MKTVTAAEANRQFSRLLQEVKAGEVFVVLARGRPVAMIGPATSDVHQPVAKEALLTRLRGQPATGARTWTRDELYEDGM